MVKFSLNIKKRKIMNLSCAPISDDQRELLLLLSQLEMPMFSFHGLWWPAHSRQGEISDVPRVVGTQGAPLPLGWLASDLNAISFVLFCF